MNQSLFKAKLFDTLRGQLILGVTLVHAALMSLFIWDLSHRQEAMLLASQTDHAMTLARSLATSAGGWVASNDIAGLQELIESQSRYPDLNFAMLTNAEGNVLAHTDKRRLGLRVLDMPATIKATALGKTPQLVDIAVPSMLGERHVGWARVGIGTKETSEKLAAVIHDGILYALAAILIGAVLAWLMAMRVTKRLYAIQMTINDVKSGNTKKRTHLAGNDEAAMLAGEFDAMLDVIAQREADLIESREMLATLNETLEHQVAARTSELADALQFVEKNESDLKQAQQIAHIGSWSFDVHGNTLSCSDEMYSIFGMEAGAPANLDNFIACIHPDDLNAVMAAWSAAMTGAPYDIEHRILVGGRVKWVHEQAKAEFDEQGKPIVGIGTVHDITEQKNILEKLKESVAFNDKLIESSPYGMVLYDDTGQCVRGNQASAEIIGATMTELLSQNYHSIKSWKKTGLYTAVISGLASGQMSTYTCSLHTTFGKDVTLEFRIVPLVLNGKTHLLLQYLDVSGYLYAQKEIAAKNSELARSNEDLQHFAYIASHDLQEPLRMVSSYVQLLERRYKDKLDDDAKEFINFAVDGATRMQGMINDLLSYSRVTSRGKEFERVDCEEILTRAIGNLKMVIEENAAEVNHSPLPVIRGDTHQLVQLFQNLIANAIKFRSDKRPVVDISIQEKGDAWEFAFADNGMGFDQKHADRIFKMFQRLHGRGEIAGSGIGLAVARKIVERHGGSIWAKSAPGQGATFYFTIPTGDTIK